ncbi:hypothetical protein [Hydrocarboniphaga sp.]|uniref:hypothetical protein n=1 Tax=Hydrocarboniphaga sp. TaxID=2033016 RepID=UPI003D10D789
MSRLPDSCVHDTGMLNPRKPTCDAGINYRELGDGHARPIGWVKRMPCVNFEDRAAETVVHCPHYRAPTAEELAAEEAQWQRKLDEITKAMPVISAWKKTPPRGKVGTVACPICGGTLHLSQAATNGHVAARCDTAGCVELME